jgi:hypothetical protein
MGFGQTSEENWTADLSVNFEYKQWAKAVSRMSYIRTELLEEASDATNR